MGTSGKAPWTVTVLDEGGFERFYRRLNDVDRAVLAAAIEHVLAPLGIDICRTEWGKALGDGLYEFRTRRSLSTILDSYGPPGASGRLPARRLLTRWRLRG